MERERVAELLGGARACLRRAAAWLDASPAETLALALLLAGAALLAGLVWWLGIPRPAGPPPTPFAVVVPAPTPELVTVHVAGAVREPGLVRLPKGSRVADALDAVGGPLPDAVLDGLNLARTVGDGEQVVVPRAGAFGLGADATAPEAGVVAPSPAAKGSGARRPDGRLDLNRATPDELEELPGVGPVLAQRIVAWRSEHGGFTEVGQLREVAGIGERVFQNLSRYVAV